MKRSPLNRGTKGLKTYAPLRRFTELRRTPRVQNGASGGLVPEGGAPRTRSRGHQIAGDVVAVVRGRSDKWCEIRIIGICQGRATQLHHRITQKAGGRRGAAVARSDRASNLLDACSWCHDVVGRAPAAAKIKGWALEEWQNPCMEAVLYRGEVMYLDDSGSVWSNEQVGA